MNDDDDGGRNTGRTVMMKKRTIDNDDGKHAGMDKSDGNYTRKTRMAAETEDW